MEESSISILSERHRFHKRGTAALSSVQLTGFRKTSSSYQHSSWAWNPKVSPTEKSLFGPSFCAVSQLWARHKKTSSTWSVSTK